METGLREFCNAFGMDYKSMRERIAGRLPEYVPEGMPVSFHELMVSYYCNISRHYRSVGRILLDMAGKVEGHVVAAIYGLYNSLDIARESMIDLMVDDRTSGHLLQCIYGTTGTGGSEQI